MEAAATTGKVAKKRSPDAPWLAVLDLEERTRRLLPDTQQHLSTRAYYCLLEEAQGPTPHLPMHRWLPTYTVPTILDCPSLGDTGLQHLLLAFPRSWPFPGRETKVAKV